MEATMDKQTANKLYLKMATECRKASERGDMEAAKRYERLAAMAHREAWEGAE